MTTGFIGSPAMNLIDVDLDKDGAHLGGRVLPLPRETMSTLAAENSTTATIGFRPESVKLVGEGEGFPYEVVVVEELGSDAYAYGALHLGGDAAPDDKMFIAAQGQRRAPPSASATATGLA